MRAPPALFLILKDASSPDPREHRTAKVSPAAMARVPPPVIFVQAPAFLLYAGVPLSVKTVSNNSVPPLFIVRVDEVTGVDAEVVVSAPSNRKRGRIVPINGFIR